MCPTRPWQDVVAERRKARDEAIPKSLFVPASSLPPASQLSVLGFLSPQLSPLQRDILALADVDALLAKLASAEWSARDVVEAYAKQAIAAHQLVNCLTETCIPEGLKRADELDAHLKSTGKTVGPLHGLPISLKDQFKIKGLELNMGFVAWIGQTAEAHSTLVELLEKAGAVFYVRTNIPQHLMRGEAINNVYGTTVNPANRTLTCGGSSGGEGALIALNGSPLGVGTDIGGSIRIPAGFNGLWGFRPSYHRLPYGLAANSMEGQESIVSVLGPLSRTHSGLVTFVRSVISQEPWLYDPLVTEKKWDAEAFSLSDIGGKGGDKLCFAIMWNDGVTRVHPPVARGLEKTKEALLKAGHEVVDWEPLQHDKGSELLDAIYTADGGQDVRRTIEASGEPLLPGLIGTREQEQSVYETWQLNKRKVAYRKAYLDHWNATVTKTSTGRPVDALIWPVAPYVAPPVGTHDSLYFTAMINLLDYPTVVFPTGLACDPSIDTATDVVPPGPALNPKDEVIQKRWKDGGAEKYKGAPICLQCVGRTGREEQILGIAKKVGEALKV